MKNYFKERWLFFRQLKNNPGAVGAAFPSSRTLAKIMVQQIPKESTGLIVELGAGTGSITKYLQKKFMPSQLVIVERSQELYDFLKKKFPNISIVLGDAIDLSNLVKPFLKPVGVIISSLPLRSLPVETVTKIQTVVFEVLSERGLFVQFTYDPRDNAAHILPNLKYLYSKKVWLNIPPARIDIYQKC